MLYMTTRDNHDTSTVFKPLTQNTAPDGGLFIPFHLSSYTVQQMEEFIKLGFSETVARILNRFFQTQLSGWSIESCLGRNTVKIQNPGRKIWVAQTWHNPGRSYDYAVRSLYELVCPDHGCSVTNWAMVAVSVAYMFGTYTELRRCDALAPEDGFDISVRAGTFIEPAAAFYSKLMGLPINRILICTKENSAIWDLVNHGQFGTSLLNPDQKVGLERLICGIYGHEESRNYNSACVRHGVYTLPEEGEAKIVDSFFAAVIGGSRIETVVNNVLKTGGCRLDADAAVCFAGIQDYRAKTGQGSIAVLFSHTDPEGI